MMVIIYIKFIYKQHCDMIKLKIEEAKSKMQEAFESRNENSYAWHNKEVIKLEVIREELQDLLILTWSNTPYGQCIRILLGELPIMAL